MKQKIIFLFTKVRSIRKRVWAVVGVITLLAGFITWENLSDERRWHIKSILGSLEARERLGLHYLRKSCGQDYFSKRLAIRGIEHLLAANSLDSLLGIANGGYHSDRYRCSNYDIRRFFMDKIDRRIKEKYGKDKDYSPLEKRVTIHDEKIRLFAFYIRNYLYDQAERFLSVLIDDYRESEYYLFDLVDFVQVDDWSEEKALLIFNRLIEMMSGKVKQKAKYKLAQFMLENQGYESKVSEIMNELEKEGSSWAFILAGNRIVYSNRYSDTHRALAKEHYNKALKYDDDEINREAAWNWLFVQSCDDRQNPSTIWYLERAGVNENVVDKSDPWYTTQLADLYFKIERYDKARVIYEAIFYYAKRNSEVDLSYSLNALTRLGDIYFQGLGIRQDPEKAKDYYGTVCNFKKQEACDKYREVNEKFH